jgi:hypothetical protein
MSVYREKLNCQEEQVMAYEVYLYSIPKVSADGTKSLPGPESQKQDFSTEEEARTFAAEHKEEFDRVVLMQTGDDGQKMIERYMDGKQA